MSLSRLRCLVGEHLVEGGHPPCTGRLGGPDGWPHVPARPPRRLRRGSWPDHRHDGHRDRCRRERRTPQCATSTRTSPLCAPGRLRVGSQRVGAKRASLAPRGSLACTAQKKHEAGTVAISGTGETSATMSPLVPSESAGMMLAPSAATLARGNAKGSAHRPQQAREGSERAVPAARRTRCRRRRIRAPRTTRRSPRKCPSARAIAARVRRRSARGPRWLGMRHSRTSQRIASRHTRVPHRLPRRVGNTPPGKTWQKCGKHGPKWRRSARRYQRQSWTSMSPTTAPVHPNRCRADRGPGRTGSTGYRGGICVPQGPPSQHRSRARRRVVQRHPYCRITPPRPAPCGPDAGRRTTGIPVAQEKPVPPTRPASLSPSSRAPSSAGHVPTAAW